MDSPNYKRIKNEPSEYIDNELFMNSVMHVAIHYGEIGVIRSILNQEYDPDERDNEGDTPLILAISKGNVEIVELLLAHGANPNIKDGEGKSAKYWNKILGNQEILDLLVKYGLEFGNEGGKDEDGGDGKDEDGKDGRKTKYAKYK